MDLNSFLSNAKTLAFLRNFKAVNYLEPSYTVDGESLKYSWETASNKPSIFCPDELNSKNGTYNHFSRSQIELKKTMLSAANFAETLSGIKNSINLIG
ncbi:MAG: hypothetical protein PHV68_04345 [Candidatus Gastranaerophilales bacterium]|nr:hypothetical protein [Candidatus Gastranaerophilales bacterium]